jgi:hypothetical protein
VGPQQGKGEFLLYAKLCVDIGLSNNIVLFQILKVPYGGESGIRTHGTVRVVDNSRTGKPVWRTAPVSHQKRPLRNATNAIDLQRKYSKINEAGLYPSAHNGLVAGGALSESTTN